MKKICCLFAGTVALMLMACDLQPRIMSLPDSVGDFISARYPALLADPDAQPEIYNSAATDYGVYASPELYGTTATDDYVLYASVDDYIIPPQSTDSHVSSTAASDVEVTAEYTYVSPDADAGAPIADAANGVTSDAVSVASDDYLHIPMYGGTARRGEITVVRGDTLYSIAHKYNMSPDELAVINNLQAPYALRAGQTLRIAAPAEKLQEAQGRIKVVKTEVAAVKPADVKTPVKGTAVTTTRVDLASVTVAPGDTLYSLSRKYSVPVNDLAVMNNLTPPFNLSVGQRLKVPDLSAAPVRAAASVKKNDVSAVADKVKTVSTAQKGGASAKPQSGVTTKVPGSAGKTTTNVSKGTVATAAAKEPAKKISSDPKKKLPTITARSSSKFSWPVRGTILSHYGAKTGGLFNDGINIGAARGAAVKAAENGVVAYAGNEVKGMGNLIIIQHSDGWMTVYAHMDSMALRRGARVSVGQKIGTVGATGKVDKPQLHFEIRKGTKAYNPSSYLKK